MKTTSSFDLNLTRIWKNKHPKRNHECELTNTSTHDIFLGLHIYRKQLAAVVIPLASFTAAAAIGLRHVIAEQQAGRGRAAPAHVSQTPACSRRSIFFRLTADGDVAAQLRAAHAAKGAR